MTIRDHPTGNTNRSTSPQTILFLLDYAPKNWCSREDYHVGVCQALIERNVRSVLVFAKELPVDLAKLLHDKGIATEVIDYGKGAAHYHTELGKLVSKYSPSAVHICYFDYFSLIAVMARLRGIKTIVYEAVNSGVLTARSWKQELLRFRNRLMTMPVTRFIAISRFVKEQLVAGGVPPEKIDIRHLGVDHSRFTPATEIRDDFRREFGIAEDEVILATVSFLNPFKNPQTILEACGLLAQEGLHFRLFIAGDGEMRQELENLGERLNISDHVTWLGHIADPRRLLQASDVFALASVGEAFGFVVTEAMACGLPVVATVSGAFPEIVQDNVTGLLVPPQNPTAFAAALKKLIQDQALRSSMATRGQARAREEFGMEVVVKNTIRVYDSLGLTSTAAQKLAWHDSID